MNSVRFPRSRKIIAPTDELWQVLSENDILWALTCDEKDPYRLTPNETMCDPNNPRYKPFTEETNLAERLSHLAGTDEDRAVLEAMKAPTPIWFARGKSSKRIKIDPRPQIHEIPNREWLRNREREIEMDRTVQILKHCRPDRDSTQPMVVHKVNALEMTGPREVRRPRTIRSQDVCRGLTAISPQEARKDALRDLTSPASLKIPKVQDEVDQGLTPSTITKLQREDVIIGKLLARKTQRLPAPSIDEQKRNGKEFRDLAGQYQSLIIRQGILCREFTLHKEGRTLNQVIIPSSLRSSVLTAMHDHSLRGHPGCRKMFETLRQKYYWTGMRADVERWVRDCDLCARVKSRSHGKAAMRHQPVGYPMERIAMDLMGPINPPTQRRNIYVLVIMDYFTKWSITVPLRNKEADTVAKSLMEHVICKVGVPAMIHSDQGREFVNETLESVARLFQIHQSRTTPYRPQSDGLVERQNRTLIDLIRVAQVQQSKSWDEVLPLMTWAYNTSVHMSTGQTPFSMMFGRDPQTDFDLDMGIVPDPVPSCPAEYVIWLKNQLQRIHEPARTKQQAATKAQERNYNARPRMISFKRGEWVYYLDPSVLMKKGKFEPRCDEPYLVLHKLGDRTYRIQESTDATPKVVNIDNLRPCPRTDKLQWLVRDMATQAGDLVIPPLPQQALSFPLQPNMKLDPAAAAKRKTSPVSDQAPRRSSRQTKPPLRYRSDHAACLSGENTY